MALNTITSPLQVRFFHCGEYGDQTRRPHYHALILGNFVFDTRLRFFKKNLIRKIITKNKSMIMGTASLVMIFLIRFFLKNLSLVIFILLKFLLNFGVKAIVLLVLLLLRVRLMFLVIL